jgi:hypothetical protein
MGVSKVVEPNSRSFGLHGESGEEARHIVRPHGAAVLACEEQSVVLPGRAPRFSFGGLICHAPPQDFHRQGIERDNPRPGLRLRRT